MKKLLICAIAVTAAYKGWRSFQRWDSDYDQYDRFA